MRWLRTIGAAFAMFSRLPMPEIQWDDGVMAYLLCAFPLVGVVIGCLTLLWLYLAELLGLGPLLTGVGLTVLPLLTTGGLHMDGFCDVSDALASHGSTEDRRRILKDPHIGAFALIGCGVYLLLYLGCSVELVREEVLDTETGLLLALSFVLSRSLSGLAALAYPQTSGSGLLHTFHSGAKQRPGIIILALWSLVSVVALLALDWLRGGVMVAAALLCLWRLWRMAGHQFPGLSGDLSGWFLQMAELAMLGALILTTKAVALL